MTARPAPPTDLTPLGDAWLARWPVALGHWSRFVKLREPVLCLDTTAARACGIGDEIAAIRLADTTVVVNLPGVVARGLEGFGLEVLAHEIGHHVLCPGSLADHGRTIARVRRGLPGCEAHAPLVANLYADLIVNDRLRRVAALDLPGVYRAIGRGDASPLWTLYLRTYEILWRLEPGALAEIAAVKKTAVEADAELAARVIRSYARDWLDGAGRFAALCFPHLLEKSSVAGPFGALADTRDAGRGQEGQAGAGAIPEGLAETEEGEEEAATHPVLDPRVTGEEPGTARETGEGGKKRDKSHRGPFEYGQILAQMGIATSDAEVAIRYYRERALPHLVAFPARRQPAATEPGLEGTEAWEPGMPIADLDWIETVKTSPHVIPGATTRQRTYGEAPGAEPAREPVDLYLGIDCSGSMPNPQRMLSCPVLAGAIIALSALRAGARVLAVLSGEPGRTVTSGEFTGDERKVLETLTGYLGTGTCFGIHRLADVFDGRRPGERAVHILIITDADVFSSLGAAAGERKGWDVARDALALARGGGTYVLHNPSAAWQASIERMRADGFAVHAIATWEDIVDLARAFARQRYEGEATR